jgi:hypothetical protein
MGTSLPEEMVIAPGYVERPADRQRRAGVVSISP